MAHRKKFILRAAGTITATVPPAAATLAYFPLWRARGGEYVLSGFALTLLILSVLPLRNTVKKYLRSPSVTLVWFLSFIAFFTLSKIAEQVTVISFFGLIGNLACTLLYKLSGVSGDDRRTDTVKEEKDGISERENSGDAAESIAKIPKASGTPCTDNAATVTGEQR